MLKIILCLLVMGAGVLSSDENVCAGPGVYRHLSNNSSFVICSEIGNSIQVTKIVHCPEDYIFSEYERTCVREQTNPHDRVSRATSAICNAPGPVCASCDLLVVCVEIGGKVLPLTNVSCSETSPENICDAKIRGCRPPNADSTCRPASTPSSFRCLQPGFFPDPSDCKKYHICDDSLAHYEDSCDVRYDPLLATCQDNGTCTPTATVACSSDPRPKGLSSNPNFYTVCLPVLTHLLTGEVKVNYQTAVLLCPDNKQFNDATSSCELSCKKRPDRIPDPTDCHSYYDCPVTNELSAPPVKKTCSPLLAYDSIKKICAPESRVASCGVHIITTREVSEIQISSPNITTISPSEATTQLSTVVSSPTTTKPTQESSQSQVSFTTTENSTQQKKQLTVPSNTTNKPAKHTTHSTRQCSEWSVQPDNTNCYRYYRCHRGTLVRRQCSGLTYFHPTYKRCVFGFFCRFPSY